VHLYLLQGDDGASITNRGNLPDHVDVRGLGGYVIAPPSVLSDGRRYRLHRREPIGGIAKAPERLLDVLRERKAPASNGTENLNRPARPSENAGLRNSEIRALTADDAVRKYALAALDGECQAVRSAGRQTQRPAQRKRAQDRVAGRRRARSRRRSPDRCLESAARENPGRDDDRQLLATIDSGWSAGLNNPRDLSEIAAAARQRAGRRSSGRSGPSDRPRPSGPARRARRRLIMEGKGFHIGRPGSIFPPAPSPREPTEAEAAQLRRIAEEWLEKRIEDASRQRMPAGDRLGHGAPDCRRSPRRPCRQVDRAIEEGKARGFDARPLLLDFACSSYPMTDFGSPSGSATATATSSASRPQRDGWAGTGAAGRCSTRTRTRFPPS
jgi:putative DNA primase/helicase